MEPLQIILAVAAVIAFYRAFTRAVALALVGAWIHPW